MAGFIGYVSKNNPISGDTFFNWLDKMSHTGHDSSGIVVINEEGKLCRERVAGPMTALKRRVDGRYPVCRLCLGHQRWATHGGPAENNAHPHFDRSGKIALVQSGMVENYRKLRGSLSGQYQFTSETDTEVLAVLLGDVYEQMKKTAGKIVPASLLQSALSEVIGRVKGEFALAAITSDEPLTLVVARKGRPLSVGSDKKGTFLVSTDPIIVQSAGINLVSSLRTRDNSVLALCPS